MDKHGDKKVFFSSAANKLNTKGKDDARVIVITEKNIYKLDGKTFKIHKTPVPLTEVTGFAISSGEDQAVVVHLSSDTDLVVTLRGDASAVEMVSLISEAAGVKFPVEVDSKISYAPNCPPPSKPPHQPTGSRFPAYLIPFCSRDISTLFPISFNSCSQVQDEGCDEIADV